jgi:hypothetical protein
VPAGHHFAFRVAAAGRSSASSEWPQHCPRRA